MANKRRRRLPGSYITQREGDSLAGLSCNAQAAYFALRPCMNSKTGKTQPIGYALLVRRLSVSKATVNRAIRELEDAGLISRETVRVGSVYRNIYGFPRALDSHGRGITHDIPKRCGFGVSPMTSREMHPRR